MRINQVKEQLPEAPQNDCRPVTIEAPTLPRKAVRLLKRALPGTAIALVLATLFIFSSVIQPQLLQYGTAATQMAAATQETYHAVAGPGNNIDIDDPDRQPNRGDTTTTATTEALGPTPYPVIYDANGVLQEGMPVEVFTADSTLHYVRKNTVNVRELPNTSATILTKVTIADQVTRLGYGITWSRVQTASGQIGFVLSEFITTEVVLKPTPAPTPAPRQTFGYYPEAANPGSTLTAEQKDQIVALAKSCLGVKYVYGSEDMSGFDCTGLTTYIYQKLFGITLNRSAKTQVNNGAPVSLEDIEIGDIICFDWSSPLGQCDHVGIYIGGGQYIHAAHSKGYVLYGTLKPSNPVVSIRRIIY